ncbi:MAG: Gfo/Idh/MocA family oxidoreductase [Clostridia bacterium]|nr:Gfo/Idh/MocA family oxidoreductase [Clostridia bacterium]
MSTEKKTVLAIIGCGRIAQGAHFPALSRIENVRVKYACDLIVEKAQKMKDNYPNMVEEVITDYQVALADPEVEAVFVLTPNYAHYTITMEALKAGKHVMCEKPVTVSYDLSVEMAKEADKQGKILNIGTCLRFNRSVEILEQMNREGKFGNIYHIYCSFRDFRCIPGLGGAFTTKSQSGGGVLIDWGIHYLDLILYILGGAKIQNVTADAYCEMAKDMRSYKYRDMWAEESMDLDGTNDVDDFISGYIRTDKASISFNGSWAQNIEQRDAFIDFMGDKGGARLDYCGQFKFTNGETLETYQSNHDMPDMYECEDRAFIESFNTGVKNKNNVDNILESMKLLDYLYRSAEKRSEIQL